MTTSYNFAAVLGWLAIAPIFVTSGLGKLQAHDVMVGYIASAGLPLPELAYWGALLVELGVSAAFVLGCKAGAVALVLAVFSLATAVFFHNQFGRPEPGHPLLQEHRHGRRPSPGDRPRWRRLFARCLDARAEGKRTQQPVRRQRIDPQDRLSRRPQDEPEIQASLPVSRERRGSGSRSIRQYSLC